MKKLKLSLVIITFCIIHLSIVSCNKILVENDEEINKITTSTDTNEVQSFDNEKDDDIVDELEEEKKYWASQPLEVSEDGSTCYVLDYYGGELDKKYLKFKKLDFSKNHGKHIKSVHNMFNGSNISKWEEEIKVFYDTDSLHKDDLFVVSDDIGYWNDGYEKDYIKYYTNEFTKYYEKAFNNLEEVNLTGLDLSECEDMSEMFGYCVNLKKINFGNIDTKNVKDMYKMFTRCVNLETIENFNIDTSNVLRMTGMFYFCMSLKDVDLSSLKADELLDLKLMFYKCESLENIDLSSFSPSKCSDFSWVFMNNKNLKRINLNSFNTKSGQDFSYMFYNCEKLEELDLKAFDISNGTYFNRMFSQMKSLKNIDLSSFKLANGRTVMMHEMFMGLNSIKEIDISSFDIGNRSGDLGSIFADCYSLESINMCNIDFHGQMYASNMFDGSGEIKNIIIDPNINLNDTSNDKIKQINFVLDYKKNNEYCKRRNKIYNRLLLVSSADGWHKYVENEFIVLKNKNANENVKEFYEIYEKNRYDNFPNFVTTDSMLHVYHLYFDYLMKQIEKKNLYDSIKNISIKLMDISKEYYSRLKGTDWEKEAKATYAYFTVAANILDENIVINEDIKDIVGSELRLIEEHSATREVKPIFNDFVIEKINKGIAPEIANVLYLDDYTQYKPRGHYDGDEVLEKYFKVLMLYGRTDFKLSDENLTKMAILMTYALNESNLNNSYDNIKKVIYYFAGKSDDNGLKEYTDIINNIFGNNKFDINIILDKNNYNRFVEEAKKLNKSKINSSPGVFSVEELMNGDNVSFRFIGQTYTYDAEIFKNLIYDYVKENKKEQKRLLPDFLDVPAALGSEIATKILKDEGNFDYPMYEENLNKLKNEMPNKLENDTDDILYVKWLKVLKKLVDSDNNMSFPSFMKSEEWKKKKLETFAGSYAELKHDTILYNKQPYAAECGEGGFSEFVDYEYISFDDRGYVEPQVEVYAALSNLAKDMKISFENMNMIDKEGIEFLDNFSELAMKLFVISAKELNGDKLDDEEYNLIRFYGGTIEHLIVDSGAYDGSGDEKKSNAIVADIATGMDRAREIAIGNPIKIYVLVEVDGLYKICSGGVYDFYQFEVDAKDRLTDKEWKTMMDFEYFFSWEKEESDAPDKNILESIKNSIKFQDWTNSYKTDEYIDNKNGYYKVYGFDIELS